MMKKIIPFYLLLLMQSLSAQPLSMKGKTLHIFILAGQSNMAGRGKIEPADTVTNPNIWMLTKEETWVPARDPLHFDKPQLVGVGPGLAFAKEIWNIYKNDTNNIIALVPTAVGGTKIDLWKPGEFDNATNTHPWDDAIRRIKKAMQDGKVDGILWHQGEADANEQLISSYENKLTDLIDRFRKEIGQLATPFILGEIAEFKPGENKQIPVINSIIHKAAGSRRYCSVADVNGLTHRGDFLHFDAPSARELGKRYAKKYFEILKT